MEGEDQLEGRLEVCYSGRWGNVGGDEWTENNTRVVCNSLGYDFSGTSCSFFFCIMVLCYPGFIIDKQMGQLTFPYQRPRQNHCTITVSNAHVGTCHWKSADLRDTLT